MTRRSTQEEDEERREVGGCDTMFAISSPSRVTQSQSHTRQQNKQALFGERGVGFLESGKRNSSKAGPGREEAPSLRLAWNCRLMTMLERSDKGQLK